MEKLRSFGDANKMTPKQMEAVGVVVLAVAALWEIQILRQVVEFSQEAQFAELEQKLREIWNALGSPNPAEYVRSHQGLFDLYHVIGNVDQYRSQFGYEVPKMVRTVMYVIGTFLVIAGKWLDGAPKPKSSAE